MLFEKRDDPRRLSAARTIKEWARTAWHASADDTIVVSELQCAESGCPPLETVIALLGPESRKITIHKPMRDVLEDDVAHALRHRGAH